MWKNINTLAVGATKPEEREKDYINNQGKKQSMIKRNLEIKRRVKEPLISTKKKQINSTNLFHIIFKVKVIIVQYHLIYFITSKVDQHMGRELHFQMHQQIILT
jgi:hypothetical protein